ncbi:hypothetical protein [Thiomicrospira sp.]|uniref:hypothetical protein n=1 Tax=Thiomicrospira sp. TaxID=935 RepID=UPI002F91ECAA
MKSFREKVKEFCLKNEIPNKELASCAGISQQAISKFFLGGDIKSSVIEAWAKKWPSMVCYALNLECEEKLNYDQDRKVFCSENLEIIARLEKLERRVYESEESQKRFVDSVS